MTIKEISQTATIVVDADEISVILTALHAGESNHNKYMLESAPKETNPFYNLRMEFQKQLTSKFGWNFSD